MSRAPTFQELIIRLERFWADQGCVVWQPLSEKIGAGTMNPATVLRVLGPEPWRVAYVEPSFRPDDGRFAENPNRMQMHMQYQVILKPGPDDPQELYLNSLEALGLDRKQHDIRFVEDNWEQPALGAWGLGWEVWLDGLEITQFTYFQQAGGISLDPIPVELTYGLERIAMYLQEAREVWQLRWNDSVTYGDILKAQELEYCQYEFHWANVDRLQTMYGLFNQEAKSAIDRGLVIPATDYVLRCSHTFNLLDVRGAIGVTERARYFAEIRGLARQVAEAFVSQREEMGHPLLGEVPVEPPAAETLHEFAEVESADLLFEIGSEELPPADVRLGINQLRKGLEERLATERLTYDEIQVTGTPRRLVAFVRALSGRQPDQEQWVRGPAARSAYDDSGKPTRALEGFCRGQGVQPDAVEKREDEKGVEYVYAHRKDPGLPAGERLVELLPDLLSGISFPKTMRWGSDGVAYSRPIRWIVSLFGTQIVPFSYAGVHSGRTTRGLRSDRSRPYELAAPEDFLPAMADAGLIVDRDKRREVIRDRVSKIAAEIGGRVPDDAGLLDEVTDLVEAPQALLGTFDEAHLKLPQEVLITVMRKHQRYFPVLEAEGGRILPYFITVANGAPTDPDGVVRGNEAVIRARYADAAYFYREDSKTPLEDHLRRLDTLTYQEGLGSVLEKSRRIGRLVAALAPDLGLEDAERESALRAATLSKADLATSMVIEMTSLQGTMGRYYALASGEPEGVATAIEEHYRPRFPGDALPESPAGFAVSVADRLDSLAGLFTIGIKPRATADPYGLRRDALGLLANLIGHRCHFSLRKGLEQASGLLPVEAAPERLSDALDFILRRLEVQLREEGFRHDLVEATITGGCDDPYELRCIVEGLAGMTGAADWLETLHAYSRCKRIVRDLPERYPLSVEPDKEDATLALHKAYQLAIERMDAAADRIGTLEEVLKSLRDPVNRFFDAVMVMDEDPALRQARLSLVQHIAALPDGIVDLSCLDGF